MTHASSELAELHDELRSVARDLLAKAGEEASIDWGLITQSGWLGLEVGGEFDGADATFAEVAVILDEVGRAAARGPYSSVALAVGALNALAPSPARDELLCATVGGTAVPVVGLPGESPEPSPFRLELTSHGAVLSGRAEFVADGIEADRLLLPAIGSDGPVLVAVAPSAAGITVGERPVVDATRRFADITAEGVEVDQESVWHFAGDGPEELRRLQQRAAIAVACDSLGIAAAMLDATVAYAGVREQFGRKIGSFQAVKHACADMLVAVSVARRLVAAAVVGQTENSADAALAAHMAKSYACAAAVDITGKAMQLHGGIGYTWESGVHVYLKRAALNRSLYGSLAAHRRSIAERYRA
ncbi:acyl-CoA/acyl-ACP dehydrogenase [Aldersonia sp. NBC_00410]|uniref:acyl-CoA dehydrogenase family protein n=1 Tax=Aldersonia sp. NBC_00410 TaxID=2975954 RepID=UPI0022551729|nr:acyl-CoA dehydrogenase family protein [Aldersonia sp. NBC_00410]MCX5045402.1 acyl-CoA/acyl-ACP dehydrogenase [Aldersonia sp. NBC_00410]